MYDDLLEHAVKMHDYAIAMPIFDGLWDELGATLALLSIEQRAEYEQRIERYGAIAGEMVA